VPGLNQPHAQLGSVRSAARLPRVTERPLLRNGSGQIYATGGHTAREINDGVQGMTSLNLVLLDETQNQAFDTEYHSRKEMEDNISHIASYFDNRAFSILDLGGGNGRFLDELLERFPNSNGVLLDVSDALLTQNKPHSRKQLMKASVDQIPALLHRKFDLITINWLLHHLVGQTYRKSHHNAISLLDQCKDLLNERGMIIVTENMFDGVLQTNVPSWLIYSITSVRTPWFAKIARRFFNTAGVGVCFNSRNAWRRIFREAQLAICDEHQGIVWQKRPTETVALRCLGLTQVSTRHFYLRPAANG
jgi:2-polyprenyl-3-methyl-5-hydroxy-6-metoxy-1,4-benzoquinol methylase